MKSASPLLLLAVALGSSAAWAGCSDTVSSGVPSVDGGADAAADDASIVMPEEGGTGDAEPPVVDGGPEAPTYSLLYVTTNAYDAVVFPLDVTFVAGPSGEVDSWKSGTQQNPDHGTTKVGEVSNDGLSSLGRWNDGQTAGTYFGPSSSTFPPTRGFHYAIVTKSASIPTTGTTAYSLLKGTAPTYGAGPLASVGTVLAKASVAFQSGNGSNVGLELTITMPNDGSYTIATTGGAASPSQSNVTVGRPHNDAYNSFFDTVPLTTTGTGCTGGAACSASVAGMIGGGSGTNAAARLALAFTVVRSDGQSVMGTVMLGAP